MGKTELLKDVFAKYNSYDSLTNARKFYFTDENKYVLLNNAIDREVGRFLKRQTSKIPDIYEIDKNGLLRLIWEKTKRD